MNLTEASEFAEIYVTVEGASRESGIVSSDSHHISGSEFEFRVVSRSGLLACISDAMLFTKLSKNEF